MKSILTQVFVSLGVIFLILILVGVYFFVMDPLQVKPLLFGSKPSPTQQQEESSTASASEDAAAPGDITATGGFQLSPAQTQALISFGIDPARVPSSISAEQEACFTGVLGEGRVAEIKAGAVPNALEFYRAKSCVN